MKLLKVTMTREGLRNRSTLRHVCFEFADVMKYVFVQSCYEWIMCRNVVILTIFATYSCARRRESCHQVLSQVR